MKQQKTTAPSMVALSLAMLLTVTACGQSSAGQDEGHDEHADDEAHTDHSEDTGGRESVEVSSPQPRLGITYDGGVAVLNGETLEVEDDFEAEGFLRLNPAGDGRYMFLTDGNGFRLLDTGTWAMAHGDHSHYYTMDPLLTDITVEGPEPGHVVAHEGKGALFFDGNGEVHTFDLADLDPQVEFETEVAETQEAHHGVAVAFEDGSRFETLGNADDRFGVRVLDSEGEEIARDENCPGVHGEATGPDGVIAVGCEDGALVWDGDDFTKIDAGPEYARTGNLFPAEDSNIMLGDYNEEEGELMTQVALVDVEAGEITTADVGSAYNFRSLARGPESEALVLAEDGYLHVLDPETGEETDGLQVMDEWTEPEEWQEPRPAIQVVDEIAYITDPAEQVIHAVDLGEMEIIESADLDFVPNELSAVDGQGAAG